MTSCEKFHEPVRTSINGQNPPDFVRFRGGVVAGMRAPGLTNSAARRPGNARARRIPPLSPRHVLPRAPDTENPQNRMIPHWAPCLPGREDKGRPSRGVARREAMAKFPPFSVTHEGDGTAMSRRILTAALCGLFGALTLSGTAEACHKCGGGRHRGQTYTYNGSAGMWSGGSSAYCAPCAGGQFPQATYAAPATYAVPQSPMYAPQPSYYAPHAPGKSVPNYAPAQAAPQG